MSPLKEGNFAMDDKLIFWTVLLAAVIIFAVCVGCDKCDDDVRGIRSKDVC